MTKKLLPTMIGAALVAGVSAASADVTVFGHLDTSINNVDRETGFIKTSDLPWKLTSQSALDDTNFACNTCSIGFKGSEDLGNGLKAIFKLDFQFNMAERRSGDEKESLTDRDQWLGLAGGFGKVRVGTISTGYKSHGAMIDPLYRTSLQGRSNGLQSGFHANAGEEGQGRADNTVRWDSADFSGVKLTAHYTLDSSETDLEDENPWGIGASYSNGGILVFADYIVADDSDGGNTIGDTAAWKIGGKYSMDAFAVMGQYESGEDDHNNIDATQWHIGGSYTMGNNMIYAAYGNGEIEPTGGPDAENDAWTIAVMHSMSKRTKVYGGYNNQDQDDGAGSSAEQDLFSIGIKHKF